MQFGINNLIEDTLEWADARNLIMGSTPSAQTLKLGSEFGELCDNIAKGRYDRAKDDIGDMLVVLTIISDQIDTSLEECLAIAYSEIKDRKGRMVDGIFVKEGDE